MNTFPRKVLLGALWLLPLGIGVFIGNQTTDKQASLPAPSSLAVAASHRSASILTRKNSTERTYRGSNTFTLHGSAEKRREQACSQLADILNVSDRVERTTAPRIYRSTLPLRLRKRHFGLLRGWLGRLQPR